MTDFLKGDDIQYWLESRPRGSLEKTEGRMLERPSA